VFVQLKRREQNEEGCTWVFNIFNIPGIWMVCGCELLLCGPLGFDEWFWLYRDTQEVSIASIERLPSVLNSSR
jgi:hypothetical protein